MPEQHPHDPAAEAWVRGLLGEVGDAGPLPDDVSARLHDALGALPPWSAALEAEEDPGLDAETGQTENGQPAPATVVDLAVRRRRRGAALLVAAAAVVVAGIGTSAVLGGSGGSDASLDAASTAESAAGAEAQPGSDGGGRDDSLSADMLVHDAPSAGAFGTRNDPLRGLTLVSGGVRVGADSLTRDALRVRSRFVSPAPAYADQSTQSQGSAATAPRSRKNARGGARSARSTLSELRACRVPASDRLAEPDSTYVVVRYEGGPALLAFRPPEGDTQVVDLLGCELGVELRTTTLPWP